MFICNPKSCHVLIGHMVTAVTVTVFAKYSGRPFLLYEMRDAMLSLFN